MRMSVYLCPVNLLASSLIPDCRRYSIISETQLFLAISFFDRFGITSRRNDLIRGVESGAPPGLNAVLRLAVALRHGADNWLRPTFQSLVFPLNLALPDEDFWYHLPSALVPVTRAQDIIRLERLKFILHTVDVQRNILCSDEEHEMCQLIEFSYVRSVVARWLLGFEGVMSEQTMREKLTTAPGAPQNVRCHRDWVSRMLRPGLPAQALGPHSQPIAGGMLTEMIKRERLAYDEALDAVRDRDVRAAEWKPTIFKHDADSYAGTAVLLNYVPPSVPLA